MSAPTFWCECHEWRCRENSWTGVDQTSMHDVRKIWRCDNCQATGTDEELKAREEPCLCRRCQARVTS